jgi:hypothetical protein
MMLVRQPFVLPRGSRRNRTVELTLITTAVTVLSAQKYVLVRRAYCSENLRIISTDLPPGSAAAPAAHHHQIPFIPFRFFFHFSVSGRGSTLSSDGASAGGPAGRRRRRRADGERPAPDGGGGDGGYHRRPVQRPPADLGGGSWTEGTGLGRMLMARSRAEPSERWGELEQTEAGS